MPLLDLTHRMANTPPRSTCRHSLALRDGKPARLVVTTALAFFDLNLKNRDETPDALEEAPGIEAVS